MIPVSPRGPAKVRVFATWWRGWAFLLANLRHFKWLALATAAAYPVLGGAELLLPAAWWEGPTWLAYALDWSSRFLAALCSTPLLVTLHRYVVCGTNPSLDIPRTPLDRRVFRYAGLAILVSAGAHAVVFAVQWSNSDPDYVPSTTEIFLSWMPVIYYLCVFALFSFLFVEVALGVETGFVGALRRARGNYVRLFLMSMLYVPTYFVLIYIVFRVLSVPTPSEWHWSGYIVFVPLMLAFLGASVCAVTLAYCEATGRPLPSDQRS